MSFSSRLSFETEELIPDIAREFAREGKRGTQKAWERGWCLSRSERRHSMSPMLMPDFSRNRLQGAPAQLSYGSVVALGLARE